MPVEVPLLKEKIVTAILFASVETDQGVTGYGLTRGAQRFGMKEFINRELAPFLRGKNPLETERVWHQLYKQFNPRGQTGMWSSAVSAIDIALWDIKGKFYKEPVWRLLGGAQNPVQSYVTFGLKQYTIEQLVEVAKQLVAQGEKRLKMVVAVDPENPRVDAERVRAVRAAIGDGRRADDRRELSVLVQPRPGAVQTRRALWHHLVRRAGLSKRRRAARRLAPSHLEFPSPPDKTKDTASATAS